ncbi:unnamed protein product, partial [Discosporangium mesarthrocarpum]
GNSGWRVDKNEQPAQKGPCVGLGLVLGGGGCVSCWQPFFCHFSIFFLSVPLSLPQTYLLLVRDANISVAFSFPTSGRCVTQRKCLLHRGYCCTCSTLPLPPHVGVDILGPQCKAGIPGTQAS